MKLHVNTAIKIGEVSMADTRNSRPRASGALAMWQNLVHLITVPPNLKPFYRDFKSQPLRMLDVGCGAHAPTKVKRYFPDCEYHGVDIDDRSLDECDRAFMKRFYAIDLDRDMLDDIPDCYFDVIVLSHIIEHLQHGLDTILRLTHKLKAGGCIYIEFPGVRSLNVSHARYGFLHFHDDPTHVRLYTIPEIVNVLLANRCVIERAGVRRDRIRLVLTPVLLARGILRGDIWSGRLWDILGIAEFVFARKR
jgi:SAM-dependent methyltransferase